MKHWYWRFMVLALVWTVSPVRAEEEEFGDKLTSTSETLREWAKTEQLISEEKRDWRTAEEILGSQIEMVENKIDGLKKEIEEAKKNVSAKDEERAKLTEENEGLKSAASTVEGEIAELESKLKANLLPILPESLAEKLKPLTQRIPKDAQEAEKGKLSLSQRFQSVIGILNEVNKFNRDIKMVPERRKLEDGKEVEVTTIYMGLGQAFYVNNNRDRAGVGRPGPNGWVWTPRNEAASSIAHVLKILENEQPAAFVPLPVEVD